MKRHYVRYTAEWVAGPMSFWVHADPDAWYPTGARRPRPAAPRGIRPVPGRGYPAFYLEVSDFTFCFASLEELRACIGTLSPRVLPSTIAESRGTEYGPNNHWLSRLPAQLLTWARRQKVVKYLAEALSDFEDQMAKA